MKHITLIGMGGSRGTSGVGYGSFTVIDGQRKQVTHVEFGSRMTPLEADYDTLITAVRALQRQGKVSNVRLTIKSVNATLVQQMTSPHTTGGKRRDRLLDDLASFRRYRLMIISPEEAAKIITR